MAYPAKKDGKYTYSDYLKTPDDKRFELIEGDLIMTPSPGTLHQRILRDLGFALDQFVKKQNIGEVFISPYDIVLDQFNVLEPDVLLVFNENKKIITEANIQGAPDLAVEIISRTSAYRDQVAKKKLYEKFGVKEYWIVDPQGQIVEVHVLEKDKFALYQSLDKKDILSSPLLPGLKIKLTDIFS